MTRQLLVILGVLLAFTACTKKNELPDNSIQFALRGNIKGLDPAQSDNEFTDEVLGNVVEGLLQYHYLKRPLTPVPHLSDGMPTVSKDGLTHTFKIKKGVRFHDSEAFPDGKGREVVAEDFIYSWKRIADP